jgi:hypothetical protein
MSKKKGGVVNPPCEMVEPMGVEPTASRVRFQNITRHRPDNIGIANQFKTYFAECRHMSAVNRHATALVRGQKADSAGFKTGVALLIAYLMVCCNSMLHKKFSTAVRELSVFFSTRRRQWINLQSVPTADTFDVRTVKRISGQL